MLPGLNPKKIQQMMKHLGMSQEEIPAEQVIIKKADSSIIINNPSVTKINMQGQENFQISGDITEEDSSEKQIESDIQTIIEKTNCDKETAALTLEKHKGDLAEAILELSSQ